MENNKIRFFNTVKKEYYEHEFNDFVNSFIKNGFFTYKTSIIEATIIKPYKIEDKDKTKIIDFFINKYNELESLIINSSSEYKKTQQYKDNLYKLLIVLGFYLLKENEKITVLKMLNVDQLYFKSILFDFNLNNYKKNT